MGRFRITESPRREAHLQSLARSFLAVPSRCSQGRLRAGQGARKNALGGEGMQAATEGLA